MGMPIDEAIRELLDSNIEIPSESARKTLGFLFDTEEGKDAFDKWMAEHENDRILSGTENIDFQKLYSRISNHIKSSNDNRRHIGSILSAVSKVAAILLVPVVIGASILIYHYDKQSDDLSDKLASIENYDSDNILPVKLNYSSPAGSRLKIELSDGTKVCLNGNSKLSISRVFGMEERRVRLEGEALFDVAKDSLKRFVVEAGNINVTALGTSFYVMAYPDESEIETVLLSGRISIETADSPGEAYLLEPNQKYTYKKKISNETIDKVIETKKYHAWTDGELIFENEPMANMIKRLEHYYNVDIVVTDSEIYTYSFTASLDNCSVEQILEYLKYSSPINYSIDKNIITLSRIK